MYDPDQDQELKERLLPNDPQDIDLGFDPRKVFNNEYNTADRKAEAYFKEKVGSVQRLESMFRTDFNRGLSFKNQEDLEWREKKWGNNHLKEDEPNRIIDHIIDALKDPTLRILLIASIVSLIIGVAKDGIKTGWIEGTAIFFAVFIVVTISSYMNYNEKEQFLKLSRENKLKKVMLKRDGQDVEVSIEAILVGDILKLKIGDIVNVDGFILEGSKAEMDESPVTGESDLMKKQTEFAEKDGKYATPIVFSGSQIQDGYGYMVVAAVGSNTFEGQNKQLMEEGDDDAEKNLTPLKKQLSDLCDLISDFGNYSAATIGLVMIMKEVFVRWFYGMALFDLALIDVFVSAFIIAVTVLVVAIPEGLPMAVTIALAYSVESMKEEHNLVKHLDKSEAMGNVNNVCTDKTGTLTLGEMSVIRFFLEGDDHKVDTVPITDARKKDLIWNCVWKNITCVESLNDKGEKVLNGDMTEKALYKYLRDNGYKTSGNRTGLYVLPFKSEYKYMMNIYKDGDGYILYAKGAPERVGEFMTGYLTKNGKEEDFEDHKDELFNKQSEYAENSIRTLVFAYKKLTKEEVEKAKENHPELDLEFFKEVAQNLTFAFMVGIRDNYRPDVPEAILKCHHAGITVRMVTGDNITTGLAISKDVNIISKNEIKEAKRIAQTYRQAVDFESGTLKPDAQIMNYESPIALEGEVFRVVSGGLTKRKKEGGELEIFLNNREAFQHVTQRLHVIARASPEDKFLLVFGLKEFGNIVAVTGDGTNDAPALKQAHVGFAMGIRGTDIAKDAADVVLLDDSFSSIVTACKYGRNVYDCIRKFVQFQLTTNVVAVFMTFVGSIILKDAPLNAIQMLWVNLIMDSFASLALATEKPTEALLDRQPYKRDASILTPMMILNIGSQAVFQIIVLTIIIFLGDKIFGVPSDRELSHFIWNEINGWHFTIFFDIFVFLQVMNSINARKLQKNEFNVFLGIGGNWYYIFIQSFIFLGQVIIVTFGGRAVRVHRLSIMQHLACMFIASLSLVWGFFTKLLPIDVTEKVPQPGETKKESRRPKGIGYASRGGMKLNANVSRDLMSRGKK